MRRRTLSVLGVCVVIGGLWAVRPTAAQDAPPLSGSAESAVEKVMDHLGHGDIEEAVRLMDRPTGGADLRADARAKLIALRDAQVGAYHGYDVAQTVRFTARVQVLDVMAYYDQQPVLVRFQLYHPAVEESAGWSVLAFEVQPDLTVALQVLREDAPNVAAGRGGRAAR